MDLSFLGVGAGAAVLAQASKADGWSRWVKLGYAVMLAFGGAALINNGINWEDGLLAMLGALATHGALLADTPIGQALKWDLLGKIFAGLSEVAKNIAGKPKE